MPSNHAPIAQFLRQICERAQRSTIHSDGQRHEFFLINLGPSGMDILRTAADTIERSQPDRGAEIAALEQRVTDLGVQFAQALSLMAGAASSLEAIDQYPALGVGAWKQARVLREAIEQARVERDGNPHAWCEAVTLCLAAEGRRMREGGR